MAWSLNVQGSVRGKGVALSRRLLLTCAHIAKGEITVEVEGANGESWSFSVVDRDERLDVALLEPENASVELGPEPVVIPRALWRGERPSEHDTLIALPVYGHNASSSVQVELRAGPPDADFVEFVVPGAREAVHQGFSGAPVLRVANNEPPRLLGIVCARDPARVDVSGSSGAGWLVPVDRIAQRFPSVAELVETPVEHSPSWLAHWEPRSRGVVSAAEPGFFYTGNRDAYVRLHAHLEEERPGLLVVLAERARGKSALLARATVLSCRRYLTLLADDAAAAINGYPLLQRPVDAAVFARGSTPEQVASEIASQLGLGQFPTGDVARHLMAAVGRMHPTPRVVIDAVDESAEPDGVTALGGQLVGAGVRAVIALHRNWATSAANEESEILDLDGRYNDETAIAGYVAARLKSQGPYNLATASQVGRAVAERAKGNFLMAELASRKLTRDQEPIDTRVPDWRSRLPADLTEAFRDYLDRFGASREQVLTILYPLAFALGDGLTIEPGDAWLAAANRLRLDRTPKITHDALRDVASRADDYLITQISTRTGITHYRLWHVGLGEAIRTAIAQDRLAITQGDPRDKNAIALIDTDARERFTDALAELLPDGQEAPASEYDHLEPYLLRHLPTHFQEVGRTPGLLDRPGMLLACDAESLRSALILGASAIATGDEACRLALVESLAQGNPGRRERATEICAALCRQNQRERTAVICRALGPESLAYELISGPRLSGILSTIHDKGGGYISALAVCEQDGVPLIVSGGSDLYELQEEDEEDRSWRIRTWHLDGRPGPLAREGRNLGSVVALAVIHHDGAPLVVAAHFEGALTSWRLDGTAGPVSVARAYDRGLQALAVIEREVEPLIVCGGWGGAIRSWRLDGTPGPLSRNDAHPGGIFALAIIEQEGRYLIVSAGDDDDDHGAINSCWLDGSRGPLSGRDDDTRALGAIVAVQDGNSAQIIAAGYHDILSWRANGAKGPLHVPDAHDIGISALATVDDGSKHLIVSADEHASLRSWHLDGSSGPLRHDDPYRTWAYHTGITALVALDHNSRPTVLGSGTDNVIRSWFADGVPDGVSDAIPKDISHVQAINALASTEHEGCPLIISAGDESAIRSWRLDGRPGPLWIDNSGCAYVWSLALTSEHGEAIVVCGARYGIRSWLIDGSEGPISLDYDETGCVYDVVIVECDGRPLLVGCNSDGALLSWRLDGEPGPLKQRKAHEDSIHSLGVTEHDGETLIITGGDRLASWYLDGSAGPLSVDTPERTIYSIVTVEHNGAPLVFTAGGARLQSWRLDGSQGPFWRTISSGLGTLVVSDYEGEPLVVGAGGTTMLCWRLDEKWGELRSKSGHHNEIRALAITQYDGKPLLVSAGADRSIMVRSFSEFSGLM